MKRIVAPGVIVILVRKEVANFYLIARMDMNNKVSDAEGDTNDEGTNDEELITHFLTFSE